MASLTGNSISSSYNGLLKTTDNAAIGVTEKNLTDGDGNASTLSIGTASASFTGTLDLAGATVTGLPGGAPGLVSGTGTDSMKSADSLTALPAAAPTTGSIAMGPNAVVEANATRPTWTALGHIAIGKNAFVDEDSFGDFYNNACIAIGEGATANASYDGGSIAIGDGAVTLKMHGISIGAAAQTNQFAIALGQNANAIGSGAVVVGRSGEAVQNFGIAIGEGAKSRANYAINIGYNSVVDDSIRVNTVSIGYASKSAQYSTAIGANAFAVGDYCISIGDANTYATGAIAIGDQAQSSTPGAVALGRNINAVAWNDSTTVNQLAIANYTNLNYADNAAAGLGGVPLGGVYHTDGNLKVRHT